MSGTGKRKSRGRKAADAPPALTPSAITTDTDLASQIGALVDRHPPFAPLLTTVETVPLRQIDTGFRGLFWVVTGQQISAAAGRSIFNRTEERLGAISPEIVTAADDALLRSGGLSAPKIRTLRAISTAVLDGTIDLVTLTDLEAEAAIAHLTQVKGIGRWTAEVYLLFALGHPDIFPAGDLALKEGVRLAFELEERPAEKELAARAEDWRPYRSAAARLLWAYYGAVKRGGANATPA